MAQSKMKSKVVTEKEIYSGRLSIPATVRDLLFPNAAEKTKISVIMEDEMRDFYHVVFKLRKNRTKPEIMAKGGKNFVQKRNLKPADVLEFSPGNSRRHVKVEVKNNGRNVQPPPMPAVMLELSLSIGSV